MCVSVCVCMGVHMRMVCIVCVHGIRVRYNAASSAAIVALLRGSTMLMIHPGNFNVTIIVIRIYV